MKRVSLMLIAVLAMVISSVETANACNGRSSGCRRASQCCQARQCCQSRRCYQPKRCCQPRRCCNSQGGYGGGQQGVVQGAADCGCNAGQVIDAGTSVQPTPTGDVIYENGGAVESATSVDSVPVEAPDVPDAPATEEEG
jgi:hypothetical protein